MYLLPALRGADDRAGNLHRLPLGGLRPGLPLHRTLPAVWLLPRFVLLALQLPLVIDHVARTLLGTPTLPVLDERHGLVQPLNVPLNLYGALGERMHSIDHQMHVVVVSVAVQRPNCLVLVQPHVLQHDGGCLVDLLRGRLLSLAPTQHVVVDGIDATRGLSR